MNNDNGTLWPRCQASQESGYRQDSRDPLCYVKVKDAIRQVRYQKVPGKSVLIRALVCVDFTVLDST